MSPQQSIAHYKILSKLGEGGMGVVYRATDTRLNRDVAVKVLPDSFAADPDRMARFEREAQVLAALNHPNIAQIYGVEERALVMELVPGPGLDGRLQHGPIPVQEAIPIARQIAEALEYAHEHGIVHRDLKPVNIKITPEGRVKILDFGLAKAVAVDLAADSPVSSPTLTMRSTQMGIIVGTAAYMAPEQARGQEIDKRADIWAFAVVLFEMLSGRRLFEGPSISDTLAGVLRAEPEWSALPADLPPNLRTMLRRCLERDPRRRLRDIGDARLELENPIAEPAASPASTAPPKSALLPWIVAALCALAAALAFLYLRHAPAPAPVVRFSVPPPPTGTFGNVLAVSPDGRTLAFTASTADGISRVWIRSLDSLEARPLAGTEGTNITNIFWSPDSRFLVFQGESKVTKIAIAGGPPQALCDSPNVMLGGSWSSEGMILFGSNTGPLMRVSSAGGMGAPVTHLEPARAENFHSDPIFLPDGRHFLYFRHSARPENQGVYVGSLDVKPESQNLKRIQSVDFSPGFAPPRSGSIGHLLFIRGGTLMAQPFDSSRMESAGEAVPIAEHVGTALSRAFFSVSPAGVLAYRGGSGAVTQLTWHDRQGHLLARAGEPGDYDYQDIALSPDGSRVAYSRATQSAGRQIWILDLARAVQSRFTFVPDGARGPVWSPDGRYLAFGSQTRGALYRKQVNSSEDAQLLFQAAGVTANHWSRDGRYLVFNQASGRGDLTAIANPSGAGTATPIVIANSEFSESHGQVSPDSRWLAYDSNESGRPEIYVIPFPPGDGRTGKSLVSSNGGSEPRWRADGTELYYLDPSHSLMAVDVSTQPTFQAATPQRLFSAGAISNDALLFQYDVARDGKRFLMISPVEGAISAPATVVLNWDR